jgi:hypothetical protein
MSGEIVPPVAPAPAATPPPPPIPFGEILAIGTGEGALRLPISGVAFSVTYGAKRKVTEKVADGDDDATATDGGREVRTIKMKFSWKDHHLVNARAKAIVLALDPSRKDPGQPPAWAHERNGLDLAALKNVRNVVVKEANGPDQAPGSGINTYEVTADSWSKTTTKGKSKTKEGKKFVLGSEIEPPQGGLPPGFHRERGAPGPAKPGVPKP